MGCLDEWPAIGGWNKRRLGLVCAQILAKMHDDGTHGDATAGDSIIPYSLNTRKFYNVGMEFKFGINGRQ